MEAHKMKAMIKDVPTISHKTNWKAFGVSYNYTFIWFKIVFESKTGLNIELPRVSAENESDRSDDASYRRYVWHERWYF